MAVSNRKLPIELASQETFYVRMRNMTKALDVAESVSYVSQHFGAAP
jgi:hypothetical protein